MNRRMLLDRLQLDDDLLLDEQVNAKSGRQTASPIDDRDFDLPPAFDPTLQKLMGKACLVRRFKQTGPKRLVNFNCSVITCPVSSSLSSIVRPPKNTSVALRV